MKSCIRRLLIAVMVAICCLMTLRSARAAAPKGGFRLLEKKSDGSVILEVGESLSVETVMRHFGGAYMATTTTKLTKQIIQAVPYNADRTIPVCEMPGKAPLYHGRDATVWASCPEAQQDLWLVAGSTVMIPSVKVETPAELKTTNAALEKCLNDLDCLTKHVVTLGGTVDPPSMNASDPPTPAPSAAPSASSVARAPSAAPKLDATKQSYESPFWATLILLGVACVAFFFVIRYWKQKYDRVVISRRNREEDYADLKKHSERRIDSLEKASADKDARFNGELIQLASKFGVPRDEKWSYAEYCAAIQTKHKESGETIEKVFSSKDEAIQNEHKAYVETLTKLGEAEDALTESKKDYERALAANDELRGTLEFQAGLLREKDEENRVALDGLELIAAKKKEYRALVVQLQPEHEALERLVRDVDIASYELQKEKSRNWAVLSPDRDVTIAKAKDALNEAVRLREEKLNKMHADPQGPQATLNALVKWLTGMSADFARFNKAVRLEVEAEKKLADAEAYKLEATTIAKSNMAIEADLKKRRVDLERGHAELAVREEGLGREISSLNVDLNSARKQLAEAQAAQGDTETRLDALASDNAELEEQLTKAQFSVTRYEGTVRGLRFRNAELGQELQLTHQAQPSAIPAADTSTNGIPTVDERGVYVLEIEKSIPPPSPLSDIPAPVHRSNAHSSTPAPVPTARPAITQKMGIVNPITPDPGTIGQRTSDEVRLAELSRESSWDEDAMKTQEWDAKRDSALRRNTELGLPARLRPLDQYVGREVLEAFVRQADSFFKAVGVKTVYVTLEQHPFFSTLKQQIEGLSIELDPKIFFGSSIEKRIHEKTIRDEHQDLTLAKLGLFTTRMGIRMHRPGTTLVPHSRR